MTACQNTPKTPALDMANFDLSVAPNADFYEYATGGWQKNNPLKPEYARYGSFDILRDNNEKRINELFSGMTQQKAEPGSVEQKISDLYKMGLDSVRLNAEGAAPIKAAVDGILAIGDRSQLTAAVARLHSSIANPFFGVGVQSDLMNSDINALYASQPDLIMGDRDYYLDPENESIRTAYKEYLGKIFRLSGVPEADIDKAVAGVLSIETKLAEKNWSSVELRNIPAMYNPTKKADFEKAYDAIDWAEYYKTMGIGDFEQIIVTTPSALANANELMKTAPLEDIRYYLAAQYIGAAASYLSDDFIRLDSVRLNAEGAAPIKAAVDGILAIGDRSQLTAAVARLHSSIANPFFGVGVQSDLMNSDINALYASQPDLIMGDRDYYLDPENESIRTAYKEYLGKIFRLSGVPEADIDKAVAGVLSIETKLAEKNWSSVELRNIPAMYNPTKKADFEKAYDAIDWAEYYKTMGIGDFEQIIVTTPSALANANELMKTAPLEDIRYYLAAQYIGAAASYLSDDFINASFDFFGRVMSGKQEQKPRWKRAMSVPNGTLSEAVGEMYVAKYFPEKDKARMLDMVKNLQTALGQHIAALDWMSDATKAKAQEKLAAFTVKIGYPDKWKDYTTLKIDPAKSYWENIVEANAWYTSDNISKLGKPVDKDEWHMSPQTVNAYYNPTTNEICFPAAILQPPFYNPDADDAVNYGAIGVVIGHEMTHGFDDQGRNFDKDGNMNNWWTDEDAAAFKAKTDILVKQFDAIEVLPAKEGQPAIFANGALSLGENIADQGGLRVARTAYRNSLAGREAPAPIDGFTPEQRFYLGYATLWAQNIRDEEIARLTKLDVHSLGKWRVNATLRNLQDFYDAFSIADGPMFLPEQDRVIIW